MRGVIQRAELIGPVSGQCLTLVATGEERESLGILCPDVGEPFAGDAQRLVPFDLAELGAPALADAQQGLR